MKSLEAATSRFPEFGDRIALRFRADPVFREVCEDYARVQEALKRLGDSDSEPPDPGADDYCCLLQELEIEMLRTLERGDSI